MTKKTDFNGERKKNLHAIDGKDLVLRNQFCPYPKGEDPYVGHMPCD